MCVPVCVRARALVRREGRCRLEGDRDDAHAPRDLMASMLAEMEESSRATRVPAQIMGCASSTLLAKATKGGSLGAGGGVEGALVCVHASGAREEARADQRRRQGGRARAARANMLCGQSQTGGVLGQV